MYTISMRSQDVVRKWYYVDASDQVLGRLASKIARVLRGKHKAIYTPHVDTGDHVIVLNAEKVCVTGKKLREKKYYHHSLYPGGLKETSLEKLLREHPERAIENAVKGMLPKNPLGRKMFSKLKVYIGSEHPHTAQQPISLEEVK